VDLELLNTTLADLGEPPFRSRQVWRWLCAGAGSFAEMTNVPQQLRSELTERVPISTLEPVQELRARDGTVKALFRTADGRPVEAVMMRYAPRARSRKVSGRPAAPRTQRHSLCISSQSGCPLTCTFCATGSMRFGRNLDAAEMLDQALHFARMVRARSGAPITNCVFMGMGEPMLNLDAVLETCERLPQVGISHRRITISTVGWIPGIARLAACPMPVRLALSVHAAEESLRSQLMPVNQRYPLSDVLQACAEYHQRTRRRVFVEYVMLKGVNDRYEQALALAAALDPKAYKVNLIPYNPTSATAPYEGSSRDSIEAFVGALRRAGIPATVRLTRGRDIDAACGQLAAAG
jgi:23S rRNA (adenine2503-C2)-methyltransferase